MGSSLGPVLANLSMIELETSIIPNLNTKVTPWERLVRISR